MLKKYKILILAIILTAGGITLVLSIWLYGNYQNRKMYFLGAADHVLFDVIQDFYQENEVDLVKQNQLQRFDRVERVVAAIENRYPDVNRDTIKKIVETNGHNHDSILDEMAISKRGKFSGGKISRHLISTMAIRNINWDQTTVDSLSRRLESTLRDRNQYSPFELHIVKLVGVDSMNRDEVYQSRFKQFKTRPILIDPSEDKYLEIDFIDPRSFLLYSIGWQLTTSVLLVLALIGTFFYLLSTIRKQNQLAMLRRSFVNNMTHELKTPVSTVMAAVESIQRYGAKDDKERMDRYLNISKHELEHLSDMIERVLQVDIAETNGVTLNKTSFNLAVLIDECVENTRLFAKKVIRINFQNSTQSSIIQADHAHIKNVLTNLFDNAVKYSSEEVEIDVHLEEINNQFLLQIRDNGHGIPKAYQKSVFELFFRVPSGDIHDVKGFGLGLAYVKQIIDQHGGSIQLDSELSIGSNFVIRLPK
ncbi:sensor histidine kinase [Sphingobacterium sp. DK4209]|uniref:histidine kinase n=1 Tax=Sphingobacterium zhuxiongii TaxID=2662364 RepID=A0A5Q0Q6W2_9SPHI|nr:MULTISPECIES: HAMP domain-containing sensor histidine kinase [unclassified Sphingobacterium]MVZ66315.1 sensor histidine kinase [Sphingobacterium sp. DK4209]QGA25096.1 sensor histidine kinase [Sphingobacterium sp. dk4302]